MDYINANKAAWEETFDHRSHHWGEDHCKILMEQKLPFLNSDCREELQKIDFAGKTIAQFCCNNGRELLSLMQLGAKNAVGFDIAENIINQAKETAQKTEQTNCSFVACNILDIDETYRSQFDFIFFTIGALTWFEDLNALFQKVSSCLKPDGILFINEFHPFMNMLPMPDEQDFDPTHPDKIVYSYFRKEPWIENNGMGYISPQFDSKTFISFSHTLGDILNSIISSGMKIEKLNEYNYDIGLTDVYDGKGYPLSFILLAKK